MKGTGDKAAAKFGEYVTLAKGDSYLAYLAIRDTQDDPTEENIVNYIMENLRKPWKPITENEFLVWVTGERQWQRWWQPSETLYEGTVKFDDRWRLAYRIEETNEIVTDDEELFSLDGKDPENTETPTFWISHYAPLPEKIK